MKRFTKTVLLLTLLAAATILAGCPKEPELPKNTTVDSVWSDNPYKPSFEENLTSSFSFYSANGEGLVRFHYDENDELATNGPHWTHTAQYSLLTEIPSEGEENDLIGFEATTKKISGSSEYMHGFTFFNNTTWEGEDYSLTYYHLRFFGTSYSLTYYTGGSSLPFSSLLTWTEAPEIINPTGEENRVKVITNEDNTVSIFINDVLIKTLEPGDGHHSGFVQAYTGFSNQGIQAPCEIEYSVSKIQKPRH